jgi:hypothetical protein
VTGRIRAVVQRLTGRGDESTSPAAALVAELEASSRRQERLVRDAVGDLTDRIAALEERIAALEDR